MRRVLGWVFIQHLYITLSCSIHRDLRDGALAFWSESARDHLAVHVIGYHLITQGANGFGSVQTAEFIPFQDMGYNADGVPYGMWRYRIRDDGLRLIHLRRLA